MNIKLKTNYKKAICSVLIAAGSLGPIAPMTYLNAATVSNAASTTKASSQSVKIKDTTITFGDVTAAPKGSIGFLVNATLEKESGIPADTTHIFVSGKGKVTIDGKQYELNIAGPDNKFKKISDTTVQGQLSVIPTTGKGANAGVAKNVTPELIKGKKVEVTMSRVAYKKIVESGTEQFKEQLKKVPNVQGVSIEQAGFGECKRWLKGKILPAKGLNIPIVEGGQSVIDNIGFVDGKLQIRTKELTTEGVSFDARNSAGKYIMDNGDYVRDTTDTHKQIHIHIFDIKDAATLAKCTLVPSVQFAIAVDQETKTTTCVF